MSRRRALFIALAAPLSLAADTDRSHSSSGLMMTETAS
jgi:hypothetical protein